MKAEGASICWTRCGAVFSRTVMGSRPQQSLKSEVSFHKVHGSSCGSPYYESPNIQGLRCVMGAHFQDTVGRVGSICIVAPAGDLHELLPLLVLSLQAMDS